MMVLLINSEGQTYAMELSGTSYSFFSHPTRSCLKVSGEVLDLG